MISVCIPVFNVDITKLVSQLQSQIAPHSDIIDILIIDDASEPEFKLLNQSVVHHCAQYITLENNVGRAKIRNLFIDLSNRKHLLFLDCDGLLPDDDFIQRYVDVINSNESDVIVGGRIYPQRPSDPSKILRWKFGVERESKSFATRQLNPYQSFMTNNFVINKAVLKQLPFDETLTTYGHEDTLLGYKLGKAHIKIAHIDNPVLNNDLETAVEFIKKTQDGLANLLKISAKMGHHESFVKEVSSLSVWKKTRGISSIYQFFYKSFSKRIMRNLLGDNPSMRAFDFYKLHVLLKLDSNLMNQ